MAQNIKEALDYRPESIAEQMKNIGLCEILGQIEEIDFKRAYYANRPEKLQEIEEYERCLRSEGLEHKYSEIYKKLTKMEPDIESKIIIVVLSLLQKLESSDFRLAYFEDGHYRIYTPQLKCWKKVSKEIVRHFLIDVAAKSGLGRSAALKKYTKDMLFDHFNEQAVTPMPEKSIDIVTINLQNGTYVISNDFIGLREHKPNDYHFNILPFSYVADATCPMFMKFLKNSLPEENARKALAEVSAYPLYPQLKLEIAAVLQGPGRTGKSTFQIILVSLYGKENVGSFTLTSLCASNTSSNYNRAKLPDYILNYSSEMGGQ